MRVLNSLRLRCLALSTLSPLVACGSDGSKANSGIAQAGQAGTNELGEGGTGNAAGKSASAGQSAGLGGAGSGEAPVSGGAANLGGRPAIDYGDPEVPPAQWTNITGMFAGMQSECGNMSGIFSSPFIDLLVFGVARQGLWSTRDGGATFSKLGTTGDAFLSRMSTVSWDPSSSKIFYVSGIYGWESPFTDGVVKTTDTGASLTGYKTLSAIQSSNDSVSIDFTDSDRKIMLSGGHEQSGVMFRSTDSGANWTDIGASLPANLGFCTTTLVLDSKHLLIGCAGSWSNKPGAVLRSVDGGNTWEKVSDDGVVNQPLWASDGAIYWAKEAGGLLVSTDAGATFHQASDKISNRVSPIELPDGRIVSLVNNTLAASKDGGKAWDAIGSMLPFEPNSIAYSPFRRAFFATRFDCNNNVPADAIARFGFDFKQ